MSALDVLGLGFHLSGVVAVGLLYWRLRDTLHEREPGGPAGGGGEGSDRAPGECWSWRRRGRPGGPHGDRTAPRRRHRARRA